MLLSVANTSVHFTPSLDTDATNDFAGNSHDMARVSNLCNPPRSTVSATGSVGSNALASHVDNDGHNSQYKRSQHTQNVLELPSTAMLAPCAPVSAELLAEIAALNATFVPAARPFMLKQPCPERSCPSAQAHEDVKHSMHDIYVCNVPLPCASH